MNWLEREKNYVLGALGALALWGILYRFLVSPLWTQREAEISTANQALEQLTGAMEPQKGTWLLPKAQLEVKKNRLELEDALAELRHMDFGDLGDYKVSAAGSGDPNTYFSLKRREVLDAAQKPPELHFAPGLKEDLGFRELPSSDPIGLNLVRLVAVKRLLEAARDARVQDIVSIQYPAPMLLPPPEGLETNKLVQLPLLVRLRADERDVAQFLYEVQPGRDDPRFKDGGGPRRFFCLRGFSAEVKDPKSGMWEVQVALGAIFQEAQLREQGVEIKEDLRPEYQRFGVPEAGRY